MDKKLSIIIPACNEAAALKKILPLLLDSYPAAEIIIVNDGSSDATADVCRGFPVTVIDHPYQKGNGAAIKTGARAATGDIYVFMDADGQHRPEEIHKLLSKINDDYDMVIGARTADSHASLARRFANGFYNWLAGKVTGHRIDDLTSGFRAARSDQFHEFINILPNGFSYPTTITMAFLRAGYSVGFIPVEVAFREGQESYQVNPRWRQVPADHIQGRGAVFAIKDILPDQRHHFFRWSGLLSLYLSVPGPVYQYGDITVYNLGICISCRFGFGADYFFDL